MQILENGYNFYRKKRVARRRRGVSTALKPKLVFKYFINPIELSVAMLKLLIFVFYRAPSISHSRFVDGLEDVLSFITPQCDNIIILGDINID